MAFFAESTQAKHWVFTYEELQAAREERMNEISVFGVNRFVGKSDEESDQFGATALNKDVVDGKEGKIHGNDIDRKEQEGPSIPKVTFSSPPAGGKHDITDDGKSALQTPSQSTRWSSRTMMTPYLVGMSLKTPKRYAATPYVRRGDVSVEKPAVSPNGDKSKGMKRKRKLDEDNESEESFGDSSLSLEDIQAYITYYLCKIPAICSELGLSLRVEATAIAYTKRFYITRNVLEIMPKDVVLAAIFLAGKIEEERVEGVEVFANRLGTDSDVIQSTEVELLKALKFNLIVHHPFRSLRALLFELQSSVDGISIEITQQLGQVAQHLIRWSLISDASLLYTPSQLALAALVESETHLPEKNPDLNVAGWVSKKFQASPGWPELQRIVQEIRDEVFSGSDEDGIDGKEIVLQKDPDELSVMLVPVAREIDLRVQKLASRKREADADNAAAGPLDKKRRILKHDS